MSSREYQCKIAVNDYTTLNHYDYEAYTRGDRAMWCIIGWPRAIFNF